MKRLIFRCLPTIAFFALALAGVTALNVATGGLWLALLGAAAGLAAGVLCAGLAIGLCVLEDRLS